VYYDLSSSGKLVTAIDEDTNNEIEGMWTKITTYGVPIANGFTQVDQKVSSGVLYTKCVGEWIGFELIEWSDGVPNICKNIIGGNTFPNAIYATT